MNITRELFKRVVAVPPIIIKAFGSAKLAILWSQIYYWSDKTKDPEGWVYKTREEIFDETGLSRTEQETARAIGAKFGVLESKRMGQPCTVHFRVDIDRAVELVEKWVKENIKETTKKGFEINQKNAGQVLKKTSEGLKIVGIFNLWNEQKIVEHQKMTDKIQMKIRATLREYSEEDIVKAIKKYAEVINGEGYFWTYKWTLPDFLQRGLLRFRDTPLENFKIKEFPKKKKIKMFFRGEQVVESRGKKWVIPKDGGEWLEFVGDPKDIETKEI
jgi:hypothetical protein